MNHSCLFHVTSRLLEELCLSLLPIGIGFLHFAALLDEPSNFSSYLTSWFFFFSTLASEFPFPMLMYSVSVYHHGVVVMQHKDSLTYAVSATWMLQHANVYCDCSNNEYSLGVF